MLNDGIADLTADVDHDLRGRFRAITQHTEHVIDTCDPTHHWAEIGAELENAIATAVGDNFVWAYQRAEALAQEVARTFVEAGLEAVKMPQIDAREMGAGFGELKSLAKLEAKPIKAGHKVVTGMRGSYGGVLMFGMLTSFAGLGMFNPLSLGAGLLLGRKAYKEDMENRMLRVRNEAKMNMRRFVDDVSFVVSKESRDRLKGIQRQLRDHYRGIANQTTRSLNESLQATLAAAQLEENERNNRVARTGASAQHPQPGDRPRDQAGARRPTPAVVTTAARAARQPSCAARRNAASARDSRAHGSPVGGS